MIRRLGLAIGLLLALSLPAAAVTVAGGPGDEIMARLYQSYVNVWAPVIALVAMLVFLGALFSGHRIGGKALALILTLVFLGGGLSYLSSWSGGGIAAGAELPRAGEEGHVCVPPSPPAP